MLTLSVVMADNTKKDSDSTPVKGGTDLGEPAAIWVDLLTPRRSRFLDFI